MGWKFSCGGLTLLLTILVGCKGRVFLTEDQLNIYKGPVPANLQDPTPADHSATHTATVGLFRDGFQVP